MTAAEHVPGGAAEAGMYQLRLYIAGQSVKSVNARNNLARFCETYLPGHYSIEVIDLIQTPKRASDDQIIAIPTLVRREPPPLRRVVGDLSDTDKVLAGLGIPKGVS